MATRPILSLVIPCFDDGPSIVRLLRSIQLSQNPPPFEVILVDDGSPVPLVTLASSFRWRKSTAPLRILRLTKNQGPAVARNRGVGIARGKFIVFLDSDVELFADTLANLYNTYKEDPDIVAVTGVWVKEQRSSAFFPNFKALRDWSYWINERDKSGYYFLFSTRIASIKRSVFQRLGGFDETYPAPLVEDIELTYRIARRYAIIFAPNVRVRHEFEGFWPIAKKYFLRAYYWTRLYQRRKKFDPVATTWWEALTAVSGVLTVLFGLLSLIFLPTLPVMLNAKCQMLNTLLLVFCSYPYIVYHVSFIILALHLFLIRKFIVFMVREKGIVFAVQGFFVGLVLYCFIFAGALAGRFRQRRLK